MHCWQQERAARLDTDTAGGTDTWTRIRAGTDTWTLAQTPLGRGHSHQWHLSPARVALLGRCPVLGGLGGSCPMLGGTNHPRQGQMLGGEEGERGSPGLSGAGEAAASRLIANYPRYSVSDTL